MARTRRRMSRKLAAIGGGIVALAGSGLLVLKKVRANGTDAPDDAEPSGDVEEE